ncbi:unnamed protein product [Lota lota]
MSHRLGPSPNGAQAHVSCSPTAVLADELWKEKARGSRKGGGNSHFHPGHAGHRSDTPPPERTDTGSRQYPSL